MSNATNVSKSTIHSACQDVISKGPFADAYTLKGGAICEIKKGEKKPLYIPICDPFEVLGRTYDEFGENAGLVIRFIADRAKTDVVEVKVELSDLISDGKKVISTLASKGLWVAGQRGAVLKVAELLAGIRPSNDVVTVSRPGWHDSVFVAPTGQVMGQSEATYRLDASKTYDDPTPNGNLAGWKNATNSALECANGDFLCLGLLSGFGGCLVNLMEQPTSILLNFAGTTSRGKTTAQRLGASVWGNPVRGASLVKFNVTQNAIESIAEKANGTLLAIDEGGQSGMTGNQYQTAVFNLAEGSGKHRLTAAATEKKVRRWSTCITISEEIGFAQKVKRDGRNPAAGAVARAWEIDVDDAELLDSETVSAIDGIREHYGLAGPVFVDHLIDTGITQSHDQISKMISEAEAELSPPQMSPQMRRVVNAAAVLLVAGRLAVDAGLIERGYDLRGAVQRVLSRSFQRMARDLDPIEAALVNIRENVLSRMGVDVQGLDYDFATSNRPVVVYYGCPDEKGGYKPSLANDDPADRIYFIPQDQLMELAGGNTTSKAIASALKKKGFLIPAGKKNSIWYTIPGIGKIDHYRISGSFWHETSNTDNLLEEAA